MHGATGAPRPERVCPFLAAASAAGVKLPPTHVEASARALEQLRQTQSVNSTSLGQNIAAQMLYGRQGNDDSTLGVTGA